MKLPEKTVAQMPPHLRVLFVKLPNPGSDEVLDAFPDADGAVSNGHKGKPGLYEDGLRPLPQHPSYADSGSAARFFYTAKADAEDRLGSKHPTVKPVELMRWLCRLVTPPGGVILDPFAGTGTTGLAAQVEGFGAILIEREAEYVAMIRQRFAWAAGEAVKTTGQIIAERREQKPLDGLFEGIE